MFSNLKKLFEQELEQIEKSGLSKRERVISGPQGAVIVVDGREFLNFCANNYLGLACSEEVISAAKEAIDSFGFGTASVRFICGTYTLHKDLELAVSKFLGTEDTILYTSCFDANTGLFETILNEGDAVFSDELNHASIVDGIRLCKADRFKFKHADLSDLEAELIRAGMKRRKLIVSDGVFSMDGEIAQIESICNLADKYEAMVMIDDSHGTGVLGGIGRGSVEGLTSRIDIVTSTFGKALGGAGGGFTSGRKEIVALLRERSRTNLFSNALSPSIAGAALFVLRNFEDKFANNRQQLAQNTKYFRERISSLGFVLGGLGNHPINPIILGDEKLASEMADKLFAEGVYVRSFTYPVVPKGKARIRVQISAAHTKDHIDQAVGAFAKVGRELGVIK